MTASTAHDDAQHLTNHVSLVVPQKTKGNRPAKFKCAIDGSIEATNAGPSTVNMLANVPIEAGDTLVPLASHKAAGQLDLASLSETPCKFDDSYSNHTDTILGGAESENVKLLRLAASQRKTPVAALIPTLSTVVETSAENVKGSVSPAVTAGATDGECDEPLHYHSAIGPFFVRLFQRLLVIFLFGSLRSLGHRCRRRRRRLTITPSNCRPERRWTPAATAAAGRGWGGCPRGATAAQGAGRRQCLPNLAI